VDATPNSFRGDSVTNCPSCNLPVQVSTRIVEGYPVYACRSCRSWWVEGHPDPIPPGPDLAKAIRLIVGITEGKKAAYQQMMESDISDPRWTQLA
jgi:hypothetical protein